MIAYLAGDLDGNGTNDLAAGQQGISWTYWSWNPNSGDTGGILADDWSTVNQNKVANLTPIEFISAAATGGGAAHTPPSPSRLSRPAPRLSPSSTTANGTAGRQRLTGGQRHAHLRPRRDRQAIAVPSAATWCRGERAVHLLLANPTTPPSPTAPARHHRRRRHGPPRRRRPRRHQRCVSDRRQQRHHDGSFTVSSSAASDQAGHRRLCHRRRHRDRRQRLHGGERHAHLRPRRDAEDRVRSTATPNVASANETLHPSAWPPPSRGHHRPGAGHGTIANDDARRTVPGRSRGASRSPIPVEHRLRRRRPRCTVRRSTSRLTIIVDMPCRITNIWNAKIISHAANATSSATPSGTSARA